MDLWWLYGGYVFPVEARPENSTFKLNLTLKVKINCPPTPPPPPPHPPPRPKKKKKKKKKNNRDLNQGRFHLWSKFGDSSLNGSRFIARTSKWLIHTHTDTQTDASNGNTRRPKLASRKKTLTLGHKWVITSSGKNGVITYPFPNINLS